MKYEHLAQNKWAHFSPVHADITPHKAPCMDPSTRHADLTTSACPHPAAFKPLNEWQHTRVNPNSRYISDTGCVIGGHRQSAHPLALQDRSVGRSKAGILQKHNTKQRRSLQCTLTTLSANSAALHITHFMPNIMSKHALGHPSDLHTSTAHVVKTTVEK